MKRVAQDWPPAPCQWFYNDLCGLRVLCGEYVTAIPARSSSKICLLAVSGISRRCPKVKIPRFPTVTARTLEASLSPTRSPVKCQTVAIFRASARLPSPANSLSDAV